MRKRMLWFAPLAIVGLAFFVTLGGVLVQWLWNTLTPALFGWPQVTFWQALGLLVLCRILFGGFGGGRGGGGGPRSRIRRRIRERWEGMTPEERERFRQRCGDWGEPETTATPPTA